jgi:hypothetical protein
MIVGSTIRVGGNWRLMLMWAAGAFVFFLQTMEEYWTGVMTLPAFNGPNEGIWIGIFTYWATGLLLPKNFWVSPCDFYPSLMWNDVYIFTTMPIGTTIVFFQLSIFHLFFNSPMFCQLHFAALLMALYSLVNIFRAVHDIRHERLHNPLPPVRTSAAAATAVCADADVPATPPKPGYWYTLSRILPMAVILGLMLVWVTNSPSGILHTHPREVIITLSCIFCKFTIGVMVSHVCGEAYHPWSKTIVAIVMYDGV